MKSSQTYFFPSWGKNYQPVLHRTDGCLDTTVFKTKDHENNDIWEVRTYLNRVQATPCLATYHFKHEVLPQKMLAPTVEGIIKDIISNLRLIEADWTVD